MKKRILAAVLAVAMAGLALVGCGSKETPTVSTTPEPGTSAPVENGGEALSGTLKFWTHQNPPWNESHQGMIDAFMAQNPDVTIEYEAFPYMDFMQKLQTSLISNDGADIYEIIGEWALDYTPIGALARVPEEMAASMADEYFPSALGAFTYDGAYYGLPLEFNIEYGGMLVNKKLFDQKQLSYPTTWEELEKVADATSVRNGELMEMRGFEFATADGLPYLFLGMLMSKGGKYLSDDGRKVDFSSPEAVDAMTKLVDYVKNRNWTNFDGLGMTSVGGFAEVFKDSAMMATVGPWGVSQGASFELTYGTDFEYILLPQYGEKNAFAAETGWGFVVPEKSQSKDLAWKYLDWFMQSENLKKHNIACAQIPSRKSIAADPEYLAAMPYAEPILGILDGGQFVGYFNMGSFKSAIYNVFMELVSTDTYASVADGLKAAQDTINALNP